MLASLVSAVCCWAQPPASAPIAPPTQATLPDVLLVDQTYGFEVRLPGGWTYDRTSFPGPGGAVGLLRGSAPTGGGVIQLYIFRDVEPVPFERWVELFAKNLGKISQTTAVQVRVFGAGPRPEAIVSAEATIGAARSHTFFYCVQFDEQVRWVLSLAVMLTADEVADRAAARRALEDIAGTLRVTYHPLLAREMLDGVLQGLEFKRAQLSSYAGRIAPDEREQFYDIALAGRGVGFMTRQTVLSRESRHGGAAKEGVRVRERVWRFGANGSAIFTRVDLFSSNDLASDLAEWAVVNIPPESADETPVYQTLDQMVREGDTLFTTSVTSNDNVLPDPRRPIAVDEAFLGPAWERLLPGLLGPSTAAGRAFVVYDAESRGLTVRMFRPLGEHALPGAEQDARALAFETRSGFAVTPGVIYTDPRGVMLLFREGDLVVQRSTEAAIEAAYGALRDAARRRSRGLAAKQP